MTEQAMTGEELRIYQMSDEDREAEWKAARDAGDQERIALYRKVSSIKQLDDENKRT